MRSGRPPGSVRPRQRGAVEYGCEERIAWLLRTNRLYGPEERLRTATSFAEAYGTGPDSQPISRSRISRWETGQGRVRFGVIRKYEDLLGLPSHRLVAVADLIYRQLGQPAGPPQLVREPPVDPDDLLDTSEQLLDRVFSEAEMRGTDWDVLTSHLLALQSPLLFPRRKWTDLAERLVGELIIADGLAWMTRVEAARRLLALPRAKDAIVAACISLASDPNCQVVIEPLSLLDATNLPPANQHVLDQLCRPSGERARRGALLASIAKSRRRHFTPAQANQMLSTVLELLADPTLGPEAGQLGAEIVRHALGDAARARARTGLAVTDPSTQAVLTFGRTLAPDPAAHVVERIAATAAVYLPGDPPPTPDPVLLALLGELLFSPNSDVRLTAGQTLAATPYRVPLGHALAAELNDRATRPSSAVVTALAMLGPPTQRAIIGRLLLSPSTPPRVTETAAWLAGHLDHDMGEEFWRRGLQHHAHRGQRDERAQRGSNGRGSNGTGANGTGANGRSPNGTGANGRSPNGTGSNRTDAGDRSPSGVGAGRSSSEAVQRGLVYGAGLRRHDDVLRSVRDDTELAPSVRAAATWWLGLPDYLRTSATMF